MISKGADKYNVAFNTTRLKSYGYGNINLKKEFDLSFGKQVKSFHNSCGDFLRQRKADAKKGIARFSTTSAFVYIRKGNFVFKFPDIGPYDWEGYDNLVTAIDPPWPKLNN